MLIEKIIKFELKGLVPLGRTCTPKTGYFQEKNHRGKSFSEKIFTSKFFAGGNVS